MEEVLKKTKFDDLRAHFKPSQLPFSDDSVEQAERLLKEIDFPTRKNEHWKYTSLNGLLKLPFDGELNGEVSAPQISSNAKRIIIKNGQIQADVSINGVKTHWDSMPKISEEDPFDALNLLHCTSAIEIVFDQENTSDIELVFENTENNFVFPRTYIKCCKQSKGNVIMNFQGSEVNESFINASTFIEVEENAHLSVYKIQKNGLNSFDLQRAKFIEFNFFDKFIFSRFSRKSFLSIKNYYGSRKLGKQNVCRAKKCNERQDETLFRKDFYLNF